MELVHHGFDALFYKHYEAAYRLSFLLCRHPEGARSVLFQAMLAVAATGEKTAEQDEIYLFQAVLAECEGYYLKKPHRLKTREQLQKLACFPVTDSLWQAMKKPLNQRAAVFLRDVAHYEPARIAQVLRKGENAVRKLLSDRSLDLRCASEIQAGQAAARAMLDDVHLRFLERSVPFELKLRRIKRKIDKAVPYIAAAIILFCIAAIIYTANLPVA